ncbi:MAG: hypothetical protein RLZZ358_2173 [Bacteroidota bacterium]|jgi:hypothetical protein
MILVKTKKAPRNFGALCDTYRAKRLLKSYIDQTFVADFDGFHRV